MNGVKKEHESYGMISISRFSSNKSEFFGSDVSHAGGISITISKADVERKYHGEWFHAGDEIVRIRMSANQYVDAITSGMNTQGVPCTIEHINGESMQQIDHLINKKDQFNSEMAETQQEYKNRIDDILAKLEGNIGKRKQADIKGDLETLKSHILSNTPFVLKCFDEAMEKTVSEAKHSVSNYIDHKVHNLGIEAIKDQLSISIEKE